MAKRTTGLFLVAMADSFYPLSTNGSKLLDSIVLARAGQAGILPAGEVLEVEFAGC